MAKYIDGVSGSDLSIKMLEQAAFALFLWITEPNTMGHGVKEKAHFFKCWVVLEIIFS